MQSRHSVRKPDLRSPYVVVIILLHSPANAAPLRFNTFLDGNHTRAESVLQRSGKKGERLFERLEKRLEKRGNT